MQRHGRESSVNRVSLITPFAEILTYPLVNLELLHLLGTDIYQQQLAAPCMEGSHRTKSVGNPAIRGLGGDLDIQGYTDLWLEVGSLLSCIPGM